MYSGERFTILRYFENMNPQTSGYTNIWRIFTNTDAAIPQTKVAHCTRVWWIFAVMQWPLNCFSITVMQGPLTVSPLLWCSDHLTVSLWLWCRDHLLFLLQTETCWQLEQGWSDHILQLVSRWPSEGIQEKRKQKIIHKNSQKKIRLLICICMFV